MTSPLRVEVPQAHFATPAFWRRLDVEAGHHTDHPRQLVGHVEPTNRYDYLCVRCETVLVEVIVRRGPEEAP